MTSAGEKQYYAVALLDAVMAQLPADWRVGVLYDIACQLHASAVRHGILSQYLHRLHFAVSVFHAFGHDWPCQLIYHPRKCVGFGLTDGEGCERFWYSLSKLIPYLRVAGYHLRLYTLNSQITFATKEATASFSVWFARKAHNVAEKRREGLAMLEEAGNVGDEQKVRRAWASQDAGRKAVEQALQLQQNLEREKGNIERLRRSVDDSDPSLEEQAELQSAEARRLTAQARYERKLAELGVSEQAQLRRLARSKALQLRTNALILLRRIQAAIIKRKMEVDRVVRAHRNKNSENRLRKHIKTAADRREGTVKTLVSRYNKICRELAAALRSRRRAKSSSVRPLQELPTSGLWDLDIDNPCWDDLRFDAPSDHDAPRWLVDNDMRMAIRGRLLLDRCMEEDARLAHERRNVSEWFQCEWAAVDKAIDRALREPDSPSLIHFLQVRRHGLLRMAAQWHRAGLEVPGPTDDELATAIAAWAQASCDFSAEPAGASATTCHPVRTTRSGAAFSNFVPIPADVDLDELFQSAGQEGGYGGEDSAAESEEERENGGGRDQSGLRAPASPTRSASPLSELSELSDSGSDAPATLIRPGNSRARKRARQRQAKRAREGNNRAESSKRHRANKVLEATEEAVPLDLAHTPITRTAFTCIRDASEVGVPALKDLKGYSYIDWDGRSPVAFTATNEKIVVGMLFGRPSGTDWEEDHLALADEIEAAAQTISFSMEERAHRRGNFRVKAHGTSHGGGQTEPRPLKHSKRTKKVLDRLTQLKTMQRIAHFSSSAFGAWQPALHDYYASVQARLLAWKPSLYQSLHFKKSVWLCLTINFGPRTLTFPHRDFGNLAHGFCAITALGRFNADKGGHLIIREFRTVIRFPPGSTAAIPSSLVTHYNTDIAPGESRYSVTQYTSGGIFRFVEHGLQLDEQYYSSLDAAGKRAAMQDNASRWKKGVAMLSRLPDLQRSAREKQSS
ncbi:hypothetical protein HDZ31DRAFT_45894 [Schizophyllum fasciatum]